MIRRARPRDLPEINELLHACDYTETLTEEHLKEPCIVGVIGGKVCGFLWALVGASHTTAFIDYLAVKPEHKGMAVRLALQGIAHLKGLGVKKVVSVVPLIPQEKEIMRINQRLGMKPHPYLFHYLTGDVERMGM